MSASGFDYFDLIGEGPIIQSKKLETSPRDEKAHPERPAPSQALVTYLAPPQQTIVNLPEVADDKMLSQDEIKAFIRRKALKTTLKYYHRYWPADASFTLGLNVTVYLQTGVFDCDASGSFTKDEMLTAYGIFCGVFPLYYFICEMLDPEGDKLIPALWSAQKFGWQFWYFYYLDKDYGEAISDIAFTCFLMGVLVYLLDTLPNMLLKLSSILIKRHFLNDEHAWNTEIKREMLKIAMEGLGEALAVTNGTAAWWCPYFLPIEGVLGMIIKGLLSGLFSNLVASPLVYLCEYKDIKDEVNEGELIPKTLQQEQEEAKNTPTTFCTRTTNYFRSWVFKGSTELQQPLLTADNKEDFAERKEETSIVPVTKPQTGSGSRPKVRSYSKPKSYEQDEKVVEMRVQSKEKIVSNLRIA